MAHNICGRQTFQEVASVALGANHHEKLAWHFFQSFFCLVWDSECREQRLDRRRSYSNRLYVEEFKTRLDFRRASWLALGTSTERIQQYRDMRPIEKECLRLFLENKLNWDYGVSATVADGNIAHLDPDQLNLPVFEALGLLVAHLVDFSKEADLNAAQLREFGWAVTRIAPASWELGLQTPDVVLSIAEFALDHYQRKAGGEEQGEYGLPHKHLMRPYSDRQRLGIQRRISVDLCGLIPAVIPNSLHQTFLQDAAWSLAMQLGVLHDLARPNGAYPVMRVADCSYWVPHYIDRGRSFEANPGGTDAEAKTKSRPSAKGKNMISTARSRCRQLKDSCYVM
jgi:hypothetical protein